MLNFMVRSIRRMPYRAPAILLLAPFLLAGCAHPIKITPDVTKVERNQTSAPKIAANIGYYIPADVSSIEVTTPGGGGDNVRYFPYRDIEAGYQQMLENVFTDVTKLDSTLDTSGIERSHISYIVIPTIVTSSGGSGLFTWPPTNFSVDLTCNIKDSAGHVVASPRVVGEGSADTSERIRDHAIAGKRAMEDALLKMQAAMLGIQLPGAASASAPKDAEAPTSSSTSQTVAKRLTELQQLKDKGLIDQSEYESKRKEILSSL